MWSSSEKLCDCGTYWMGRSNGYGWGGRLGWLQKWLWHREPEVPGSCPPWYSVDSCISHWVMSLLSALLLALGQQGIHIYTYWIFLKTLAINVNSGRHTRSCPCRPTDTTYSTWKTPKTGLLMNSNPWWKLGWTRYWILSFSSSFS